MPSIPVSPSSHSSSFSEPSQSSQPLQPSQPLEPLTIQHFLPSQGGGQNPTPENTVDPIALRLGVGAIDEAAQAGEGDWLDVDIPAPPPVDPQAEADLNQLLAEMFAQLGNNPVAPDTASTSDTDGTPESLSLYASSTSSERSDIDPESD